MTRRHGRGLTRWSPATAVGLVALAIAGGLALDAVARRHHVLDAMVAEGFITRQLAAAASAEPLHLNPSNPGTVC